MTSRCAVVTGGNRGIGFGVTRRFVEAGYRVVVGARTEPSWPEEIAASVRFVPCDVRARADHRKLVDTALTWAGGLTVYVNNAGYSGWRPIEEIDETFLDGMVATNLKGAFWGGQAAAGVLSSGGSIINMSSLAARRGTPNNSVYCATKFGITALTQSLAKELGPRGIRVNAVCPVLVRTEGLVEALSAPGSPAHGDVDGFLERFTATQSALGTLPTATDVGDMCVFLASERAASITGQSINVDCGVLPT